MATLSDSRTPVRFLRLPSVVRTVGPWPFALVAAAFLLPSVDFPLNDDWQYAYPVMTWVQDGHPSFKGFFAPNILLQVVWGYLFCEMAGSFDFRWLQWSTLSLAVLALLLLSRLLQRTPAHSAVGLFTGTLAFNPLFFSLAFTFMTDVPFLTCCLASLYGWFRYTLTPSRYRWAALAAVSALCSFGIRQPGLLLFPTFATTVWLLDLPARRRLSLSLLFLCLAVTAYLGMERLLKPALAISDNFVPVGDLFLRTVLENPLPVLAEWAKKALKSAIYIGLFSLPLLPMTWPAIRRSGRLTPRFLVLAGLGNGLVLAALVIQGKTFPFGGNILFNFGLGPELLPDVYTLGLQNTPLAPASLMLALQLAGQLGATMLGTFLFLRWKACPSLLRPFVYSLLLLNALYLPALSITSFFDRYLLLPLACSLLLTAVLLPDGSPSKPRPAWMPLVPFVVFSLLATHDYLAWNHARREAFQWLTAHGVSIRQMDAGYEYNGFYNYHRERTEKPGTSFWWVTRDDWMITFGNVPGFQPVSSFPYHRWLFAKTDRILVQRKHPPTTALPE